MAYRRTRWRPDQTRCLTRQEIGRILADLRRKGRRSRNTRQNLTLFRLATCLGLRVSELTAVRLTDVHLANGRPFVYVRKGKGGRSRRVPAWWDSATVADLAAWKRERKGMGAGPKDFFVAGLQNGGQGKRLHRNNARMRFKAACRCLGRERVADLTIHHGRHAFCSHALAGGRSVVEVMHAAGHGSLTTTALYLHLVERDDAPTDLFDFSAEVQAEVALA